MKKRLHPIMFAGTGSDVGKSIVAAAFCRIFRQDGYRPAPFKAQNMALNSYATPEGLEIGRAQAVQAEAAGIPCHTDMNPLLLKPSSDHTSQVVLHGKPIGNKDAYDYWRPSPTPSPGPTPSPSPGGGGERIDFRQEVCAAFDRLASKYNPIVMEGAGSIAEINLKDRDLVNMSMARHAKADVILVGDIDRGGVFASVYGSIMLQTPEERKLIKGIIINKFRGDMRLFDQGRTMLEDLCGVPVLGVIPYYKDIYIDEEDSVSLEQKRRQWAEGKVNVAVVLLRHISNFTDFDTLERDPRVNLFYTNNVQDIQRADIIILPGTKATLDDLIELRRNGCAQAIVGAHRNGKTVVGICGGYQMLGVSVADPDHIEGDIASLPGLGLLPIHTTMSAEKTTQQVTFMFEGQACQGYEIHQGISDTDEPIVQSDRCIGTYIHGFLDNGAVIDFLVGMVGKVGKVGEVGEVGEVGKVGEVGRTLADFKEEQYDKLAAHVRQYVDIDRIYQILSDND
jgi:adenosylcobyric acid synthase